MSAYRMAKVDGQRVRVVPLDGVDGYVCRWTDRCSGCSVGYEGGGGYDKAGAGCFECGYTGKRRREHWEPLPTGGAS